MKEQKIEREHIYYSAPKRRIRPPSAGPGAKALSGRG